MPVAPRAQDVALPINVTVKPQVGFKKGQGHLCALRRHGFSIYSAVFQPNAHISRIPIQLPSVSPDATHAEKEEVKGTVKQERNGDRVNFYAKEKPPKRAWR